MGLEKNSLLQGRYRIVDILGQGGMGSVYRAIDENLGLEVALKENLFTTNEYERQFRLEAVILATLRHPNLPRVTDHFVIDNQSQYLVMDYIGGEDLRQRMERSGNLQEEEVIKIGAAICEALSYMHAQKPQVLHRDLKPGNVKITPNGHVFLVDFGLAKLVQSTNQSQQTTTGARAMTPGYSPPEQYGTARTDPRSDIYSLGATLYAALTGVIPEDGLARVMDNAQLTPIRKRVPSVSRRVAAVIEKAMEPYPDDRYQTAEDFRQALLNATSRTQQLTGPIRVTPPPQEPREAGAAPDESQPVNTGSGTRSLRSRRRNFRWMVWFLAFLVVAGAAGAFYFSPDLQNLAAIYIPALQTETPTITPLPTATNTDVVETLAVTDIPAVSETPAPTATRTKAPTATPTATITSSPTITFTPTASPLPTVFGGGYGQIAFASDRTGIPQVWLMNPDGTGLKQLTNEANGACQPSWSPDGVRIVFIAPCTDKRAIYKGSQLYVINFDGSGLTSLPFVGEGSFEPTWSPDGKQIAFTVSRSLSGGKTYTQIFTLTLADNSLKPLVGTADFQARQPAWSPFGGQIVYNVLRSGVSQIWYMTDLGAKQKQLVQSGSEKIDLSPVWSLDGQIIYFSQTDNNNSPASLMKIAYVDRESMAAVRVDAPPPVLDMDFSTDGHWFIYEGVLNNNRDIYLMSVRGGDPSRITDDPGNDFDPVWRPSGQQLIPANTPIVLPTPVTPSPTSPATETPVATSTPTPVVTTPTVAPTK